MKKLNIEPMKPFSCFIQEIENNIVTKVFVNFGVVVCTASNSLKNIFVPRTASKKRLNFFAEKRDIGFNTIDTGSKGCICLRISLTDINLVLSDSITEWEQSLFSKNLFPILIMLIRQKVICHVVKYPFFKRVKFILIS